MQRNTTNTDSMQSPNPHAIRKYTFNVPGTSAATQNQSKLRKAQNKRWQQSEKKTRHRSGAPQPSRRTRGQNRDNTLLENFDTEAAETQAEAPDQTISPLRSMKECRNPRQEGQGKSRFHRWGLSRCAQCASSPDHHSIYCGSSQGIIFGI